MYDINTVKHMMRLQAWREVRWILDELREPRSSATLEEILARQLAYFEQHDMSNLIQGIDLRNEYLKDMINAPTWQEDKDEA